MAGSWKAILCLMTVVVWLPRYGGKKSYNGYHVVRVTIEQDSDWLAIESLMANELLDLELWSAPNSPHDTVDLQVAAPDYEELCQRLERLGLTPKLFIKDVQEMIDNEAASMNEVEPIAPSLFHRIVRRSNTIRIPDDVVGRYASLAEIENWLYLLASQFPEVATLEVIGQTYEKRNIYVLKIGRGRYRSLKPGIYLDGGIHAREWISPATVIYIIHKLLLENHLEDQGKEDQNFLDLIDWHFVPVANPDGYLYTHEEERLWRKNRSPNKNSTCWGTDLNRNWPYHWGNVSPFTSDNPCSIVYQGESPGSELETQALMTYMLRHNDSIKAFISHHSYTQKWFTRWGYTNSTPPDHKQLVEVAEKAVNALKEEGGEPYEVGIPFDLLYSYTGGSADWAKGVAGIKYAYTVELRDRGQFGFLLPANYVEPVGRELWAAISVVASQLINESSATNQSVDTTPLDKDKPPQVTVNILDVHRESSASGGSQRVMTVWVCGIVLYTVMWSIWILTLGLSIR